MITNKPEKQSRRSKHQVWIVWGGQGTIAENGEDSIICYEFKTAGELSAFLTGVEAACGFMDFEQADSQEEAEKIVAEATKT